MSNSLDGAGAFVLIILILYLAVILISLAVGILGIVAKYKLYEKAGEPGWSAIIPIYNYMQMMKIALGNYKLAFVYLGISVAYIVTAMISGFMSAMSDELSSMYIISTVFMMLLILPLYAISAYSSFMFGKAYGKSDVWNICMIFFSPIMIIIMGLDKKTVYVGPKGIPQNNNYY